MSDSRSSWPITHWSKESIMTKQRATRVAATVFVQAVMEAHKNGEGVDAVAEATGLSAGAVSTRMSQYRNEHGLNLPKFPRGGGGGAKLDISELSALIDRLS